MCIFFSYVSGLENDIYEKLFVPHIRNRGLPVPTLEALKYNASLVLSNSHVSMGSATRLPPNFIPVGGFHIDTAVKPLPEVRLFILQYSSSIIENYLYPLCWFLHHTFSFLPVRYLF